MKSRRTTPRSNGTDKKKVRWNATDHGPFTVALCPCYKKEGKEYVATGDVGVKIEFDKTWPPVSIGFNADGQGALATIIEEREAFLEALESAVALWSDDDLVDAAIAEAQKMAGQGIAKGNGDTKDRLAEITSKLKNRAAAAE